MKQRRLPPLVADQAPTLAEDLASLASLELAPMVAERARDCRELHFAFMRGEPEATTQVRLWREARRRGRAYR